MLLLILGILDIVVGGALWWSSGNALVGVAMVVVFGIIWILKGLWSILSAAADGFFFDLLGIFDLVSGVFLVLSYLNFSFGFFFYMALLMVLKGIYSFLIGMKT